VNAGMLLCEHYSHSLRLMGGRYQVATHDSFRKFPAKLTFVEKFLKEIYFRYLEIDLRPHTTVGRFYVGKL